MLNLLVVAIITCVFSIFILGHKSDYDALHTICLPQHRRTRPNVIRGEKTCVFYLIMAMVVPILVPLIKAVQKPTTSLNWDKQLPSSYANKASKFIYNLKNPKSKPLADQLQQALVQISFKNRGVKAASFYVLKHTKAPALLLEIAQAITTTILQFSKTKSLYTN